MSTSPTGSRWPDQEGTRPTSQLTWHKPKDKTSRSCSADQQDPSCVAWLFASSSLLFLCTRSETAVRIELGIVEKNYEYLFLIEGTTDEILIPLSVVSK